MDCCQDAGSKWKALSTCNIIALDLRLGFLQQHHVGIDMAAQNAERLAIRRTMELKNLFGVEVGDLTARRAIERLNPEVIDAVFTNCVGHRFSVGREL